MSRSTGIPRLQELTFLEVAAVGVADAASFEEIRKNLVRHMIARREASPASGNIATFRIALDDPKRYVSNTTEALKELMRLGLVEPATLPSSASAARSYVNTTFALTDAGTEWVELLRSDTRAAYNHLLVLLWRSHPQFVAFVEAIGTDGLVIPLAQWGELPEPRTREKYVDFLAARAAKHLAAESAGWSASAEEIHSAIVAYLRARHESAEARGRANPYPRNQDFISACEEAMVKLAFSSCGIPIDYISQEVLRRWTSELGIANFSYHVPGPTALRFWSTAEIEVGPDSVRAHRRVDANYLDKVLDYLSHAYNRTRKDDDAKSLWVPIHRVRAATCCHLRLPGRVFDRALLDFLTGTRGQDLPYRVNVDPAMYGTVPPSEMPLRIQSPRGVRIYYSMSLVPRWDQDVNNADSVSGTAERSDA